MSLLDSDARESTFSQKDTPRRTQNGKILDLNPDVFKLASATKSRDLTLDSSTILPRIPARLSGCTPHVRGLAKVHMCLARWPDCENASPHISETYGLSPECIRMCLARLLVCENALPHVSQTCGRSTGVATNHFLLLMAKDGSKFNRLQKEVNKQGIRLELKGFNPETGAYERVDLEGGSQRTCFTCKASILKTVDSKGRETFGGESNWPERAPEIGRRLVEGGLDVYLLQEVGAEQLEDLAPYISGLYEFVHAVHPGLCAQLWHAET